MVEHQSKLVIVKIDMIQKDVDDGLAVQGIAKVDFLEETGSA